MLNKLKPALEAVRHIARGGLCAALLVLSACGGGGGGAGGGAAAAGSVPALQHGSINHSLSVTSAQSGIRYQVSVYLPPAYAPATEKLPVIYALDGGIDNPDHFSTMVNELENQRARVILVGIGGFDRRAADFRLPGAADYLSFLTRELIPAVEAQYPVDTSRRTLDGWSFGGFFTIYAMLHDRPAPRVFANFISHDVSMGDLGSAAGRQIDPLFAQEDQLFASTGGVLPAATLVLAGDKKGNLNDVNLVVDRFMQHKYSGLNVQVLPTTNVGHAEMFQPSFMAAVTLLFK